ncbi:2-oxoadipate dioxygenase/decarboxylase family protein [Novosphingobium decolorationis]|uniref:2-oxoadipate dioxygenase/decarboxylase n=1 Tax=Novosphingobium decolorationis TaxID=2698673 RepID=A0ABX8E3P8_9SPHN|nr:DUF1338 family protein [Novosphingobium decolorationis]QVM83777.1 DUF1338 family protein [Novosphingobium decolorationis]
MQDLHTSTVARLVRAHLGDEIGAVTLAALNMTPALLSDEGERVSRASMATALGAALFRTVLDGVPSAAGYVGERLEIDTRITLDHGALRTILFPDGPTGALPGGQEAFARILRPLGYVEAAQYPLPRLRMTGHAWCHLDHPEDILQYFVSELHVDQFDAEFAAAAHRVFDTSLDPLSAQAKAVLDRFAAEGSVPFAEAEALLPVLVSAFDRAHEPAFEDDYETLLAQSKEAAWIATEGNAFNHATDRVADVGALADALRAAGKPIKDKVEHSASGRVHQTAFRADMVERPLRRADGAPVTRTVPGSFFEFITRDTLPGSEALDLGFDSGNATGIFAMTRTP